MRVPPEWGRRDAGKHFLITEWPAERAEKWALAALMAFNRGGGEFGVEHAIGRGMEGIAVIGVQTFLRGQMRAEETIPLLDQLLECVQLVRDPAARDVATGLPVATPIVSPDDVEEVQTRLWLRSEVLKLHTGFSPGDALSTLISAIMTAAPSQST